MGAALEEGLRIDRYELVCRIGDGGMGTVWVARQRGMHGFERMCAFKAVVARSTSDPLISQTLVQEARIAARIEHPNVAAILDVGEWSEGPFIVLELVDGESLNSLCRSLQRPLPVSLAVRLGEDIASGLHAAHELRDAQGNPMNVVHRDVSPHNVLVSVKGAVKVIDFGIAIARDRLRVTGQGEVRGKLSYMAPEQVNGEIDRRTDVWAVGAVVYRLLTGHAPFQGNSDAETVANLMATWPARPLPDGVPQPVALVVSRAIARNPDDRYQTAAELALALRDVARECHLDLSHERLAAFVQDNLSPATKAIRTRLGLSEARPTMKGLGHTLIDDSPVSLMRSLDTGAKPLPSPASVSTAPVEVPTAPVAVAATGETSTARVAALASLPVGVASEPKLANVTLQEMPPMHAPPQPNASPKPTSTLVMERAPAAVGKHALTAVAGQAMGFADLFNLVFKGGVAGRWPCKAELTAPGPSTGGGALALQHIRLLPADGSAAMLIGSVNRAAQRGELRRYALVAGTYATRHRGKALPLEEATYAAFTKTIENFFSTQKIDLTWTETTEEAVEAPPRRGSALVWVGVALCVVLLGGAALAVTRGTFNPARAPAQIIK